MKILNLLSTGSAGGIEVLCKDIGINAEYENAFCFLFGQGLIYEQMLYAGLNVHAVAGSSRLSLRKAHELKRLAKDFDIIVTHHNDPYLHMYYLYLQRVYPYKKFIMTIHSCFEKSVYYDRYMIIKRSLRKFLLISALKSSNALIFVSNAGKESFEAEFSIPKQKAFVVYNGIANEKLKYGMNHTCNTSDSIQLLYVGRLHKVKGVHLLLEAISKLYNDYRIQLTIVGDGPERNNLENLANDLKISEIVKFEGLQGNVFPFLEQANIFVYPSTWKEVFGISIVEAMAFGLICVANAVGGIPEIISNGENGFLSESPSANGVKKAINLAIDAIEDNSALKISMAAKKTAAKFSVDHTVYQLKTIFETVLYKQ